MDLGGFDKLPFDHRPRSRRDQRLMAPIIERILGGVVPAPPHTLDCHVGRCRLTLLARDHTHAQQSMRAIHRDRELWAAFGRMRVRFDPPSTVSDAVSGEHLEQYDLYLDIAAIRGSTPDGGPDGHLDGDDLPFPLAECRQRVAASRAELQEARAEMEKLSREAASMKNPAAPSSGSALEKFHAARPNPELTRRFTAVIDELRARDPSLAGVVECRGERQCRWSSERVESSVDFVIHELDDALEQRGMPADLVLGDPGEPGQVSGAWLIFRLR
jgi:hypothetical protein